MRRRAFGNRSTRCHWVSSLKISTSRWSSNPVVIGLIEPAQRIQLQLITWSSGR